VGQIEEKNKNGGISTQSDWGGCWGKRSLQKHGCRIKPARSASKKSTQVVGGDRDGVWGITGLDQLSGSAGRGKKRGSSKKRCKKLKNSKFWELESSVPANTPNNLDEDQEQMPNQPKLKFVPEGKTRKRKST